MLNNPGATLTVSGNEYVGFSGTGTFTQISGTHTVNQLYVGFNSTAFGSYLMNGSSASLTVNGTEYVGFQATGNMTSGTYGGSFTQLAGSHTVTSALEIGNRGGSTGIYNLGGGNLNITNISSTLTTEIFWASPEPVCFQSRRRDSDRWHGCQQQFVH